MGQLTVHINGKPYLLGCEDGEEARLKTLAAALDEKVRSIGGDGALGDTRLMLMGALMIADEATATDERLAEVAAENAKLQKLLNAADARAISVIEAAAKRIEGMAAR